MVGVAIPMWCTFIYEALINSSTAE
jgi:hypothetical protein